VSFPGLYSGRVLDVDDATRRGRVQVAVPAVFGGDGPDTAVWARPCFQWGHFFAPEVGDELWIGFENGDPSAPVWLGVWYADGEAPQGTDVTPPARRVIRTPAGHEIALDDSPSAPAVEVRDATGSVVRLSASEVKISAAVPLTIEAAGLPVTIRGAVVDVQS
jgi:uncharacterized protein involved in type VI secretion and phage assembly